MIGIAVLGAGHWGPNLIRNFQQDERSRVAWVVDPDARRLAEVGARFPDVRTGSDPAAALADPGVDAVVVATPTTTHYALTRAALLAGKHVLVEKPIATEVRHGVELCALADGAGRVLMVGHVFLFNAGIRRVKAYLDAGELGRVYYIAMVRTNLGPIRVDVNAAWDLAAHDVSVARLIQVPAQSGAALHVVVHEAQQRAVDNALAEIAQLPEMHARPSVLPVVSTPLPECVLAAEASPEWGAIGRDKDEFLAHCDKAVAADSPEARRKRSELMRAEDWDNKVAQIGEHIGRAKQRRGRAA